MKMKPVFLLSFILVFIGIVFLFVQSQSNMIREGHGGGHPGGGGGGGHHGGGGGHHGGGGGGRTNYNHYYYGGGSGSGGNYGGWGYWNPLFYYDYGDYDYYYVPVDDPYGLAQLTTLPTYGPSPVYRYYPWM